MSRKFDTVKISDVKIDTISFIMSDDCYDKNDYINLIGKLFSDNKIDRDYVLKSIIVFLPIINKKDFLTYFVGKVSSV